MDKVLVSAPYFLPVVDSFRSRFSDADLEPVVIEAAERLSESELLKLEDLGNIVGVIAGDDHFTARVLEKASALKVISKWGTGVDSFDHEACRRLGIEIRNTANAFTEPVADTTIGFILAHTRNIISSSSLVREGNWRKLTSRSLSELTVGIIGFGNIGRAVSKRLKPFGARVLVNDVRDLSESDLGEAEVTACTLPELLANSDVLTIHCDLNSTSKHLINSESLALMKPNVLLVNTARGPIVDEEALIQALKDGRVAGAALDVFEEEPLPKESPLKKMQQTILSPHNSNSSPQAYERVHDNTFRNMLEVLGKL